MLRPTHPELRVPQCGIYQARPSSAVIGGVRRGYGRRAYAKVGGGGLGMAAVGWGWRRWAGDGGAGGENRSLVSFDLRKLQS